ncbi:MAG: helix-turn-helix transcriptional regulator [bacterium]
MTVESTTSDIDVFEIAAQMRWHALPDTFIVDSIAAARYSAGVRGLLALWLASEGDPEQQQEVIADLQEVIDDLRRSARPVTTVRFDDLDAIASDIMAFKNALLSTLDERGITFTELSKRTGMPVPSLSRFFNTASMPQRSTLLKIAKAVELSAVEVSHPWSY